MIALLNSHPKQSQNQQHDGKEVAEMFKGLQKYCLAGEADKPSNYSAFIRGKLNFDSEIAFLQARTYGVLKQKENVCLVFFYVPGAPKRFPCLFKNKNRTISLTMLVL